MKRRRLKSRFVSLNVRKPVSITKFHDNFFYFIHFLYARSEKMLNLSNRKKYWLYRPSNQPTNQTSSCIFWIIKLHDHNLTTKSYNCLLKLRQMFKKSMRWVGYKTISVISIILCISTHFNSECDVMGSLISSLSNFVCVCVALRKLKILLMGERGTKLMINLTLWFGGGDGVVAQLKYWYFFSKKQLLRSDPILFKHVKIHSASF